MEAITPYASPSTFDLGRPRLADVPRVPQLKEFTFRAELFQETLVPLMHEGKSKIFHVKELVDAAVQHLEDADPLELDDAAAADLRESLQALQAVKCVAHMKMSAKHIDELRMVVGDKPSGHGVAGQTSPMRLLQKNDHHCHHVGPPQGDAVGCRGSPV